MTPETRWRAVITYRKTGLLRYLSHLDVARAIERAIRRAGWPVAYTSGFHRRMKVSLGPPLPVGAEGEHEVMSVVLSQRLSDQWALSSLRLQLPEDLAPSEVVIQPERAQSPLKLFRRAAYIIELAPSSGLRHDAVAAALRQLMEANSVPLQDNGKTIDARPRIYSAVIAPDQSPIRIRATLGVAHDNYLSPDRFLQVLALFMPHAPDGQDVLNWQRLVRTRMYTDDVAPTA